MLSTVILCEGLESISSKAFDYCSNLTSINLPSSFTNLASDAFTGCTNLENINVATGNTNFASVEGVLYNADKTILLLCPAGKTAVTVVDSVQAIGSYAFANSSITALNIPDGTTTIQNNAFYYNTKLKTVIIPQSVTSIEEWAFAYCIALDDINLPSSIETIAPNTFYYCQSLQTPEIPYGVKTIGSSAFAYCSGLEYIDIPESVVTIGSYAFHYCSNLSSVSIPASTKNIGDYAFAICPLISNVTVANPIPVECMPGFMDDVLDNAILYVPQGSLAAYKASSCWNSFQHLREYTLTGIGNILPTDDNDAVYYNMQGIKIDNPTHGLYIRVCNGKSTKVIL